MAGAKEIPWWESGVLYQVYVRSFADHDGDGCGDLRGLISHLDYLAWLGVDGIWLSPITVSPNADWGYDVADYCDVQPEYGKIADVDLLIASASERGIRVLLDLVPNHSSDRHRWFQDARSSRDSAKRNWYVWADSSVGAEPPNNWVSSFGGPAWTRDETSGQWYLHNFLPEQPDLNWWEPEVADAFDRILKFWWDRGVAGFRIDVCNMIIKDAQLRDNPPATEDDPWLMQVFGQRPVYNSDRPEVHEVLRRWRSLAETYDPPRLLLGETNVEKLETLVSYYGTGEDELHLGFNFVFIEAEFDAQVLREIAERTEELLPNGAWPVWTGSNHDVSRLATRWCDGDPAKVRAALMMLLTLRGTPVLYQGDEIGLVDVPLDRDQLLDPVGRRFWPAYAGRDPVRTPMPWVDVEGGGFTIPGVTTWLPIGDTSLNVESQRSDRDSLLWLVHDLIELRRKVPDLQRGPYRSLDVPPGVWGWTRGDSVVVFLNLSESPNQIDSVSGRLAISTERTRDGTVIDQKLSLAPWEGAVLVLEGP
ncbi:MAG TPA: alpha-amylase family glycosyl hydrolase [Acidimicrobiales bacterium]|nr:alpha-amylase family glycosyl hydrolase [Acidimicrobiales bacterium]